MKRLWLTLVFILACNPVLARAADQPASEMPMRIGMVMRDSFAISKSALIDNPRRIVPIAAPAQPIDAQAESPEAQAQSILPEDQQDGELYYDDTWRGYVGASSNRRGSPRSVLLTLALSILTTVVGYWLFGRK